MLLVWLTSLSGGFHLPQASPISATFLDPALHPQTMEAVWHYYKSNKAILLKLNAENEQYLNVWGARFQNRQAASQQNMPNHAGSFGPLATHFQGFPQNIAYQGPGTQIQGPLAFAPNLNPSFAGMDQSPFRPSFVQQPAQHRSKGTSFGSHSISTSQGRAEHAGNPNRHSSLQESLMKNDVTNSGRVGQM